MRLPLPQVTNLKVKGARGRENEEKGDRLGEVWSRRREREREDHPREQYNVPEAPPALLFWFLKLDPLLRRSWTTSLLRNMTFVFHRKLIICCSKYHCTQTFTRSRQVDSSPLILNIHVENHDSTVITMEYDYTL